MSWLELAWVNLFIPYILAHASPCALSTVTGGESPLTIPSSSETVSSERSHLNSRLSEDEEGEIDDLFEGGSTPPPPPAFQDPPGEPLHLRTLDEDSELTEVDQTLPPPPPDASDSVSPESTTISKPFPSVTIKDIRPSSLLHRPYELPVRQRFRSSQTLTIPGMELRSFLLICTTGAQLIWCITAFH